MKVAIYARSAVKDDNATKEQIETCKRHASEQGWGVVQVYEDCGESGASISRAGLTKMLDDAADGDFELLLVTDVKRFSRQLSDLLKITNSLKQAGVKIVTPNGAVFAGETPEAEFADFTLAAASLLRATD